MSEGSRLSRWSQRKQAARQGGALPEPDEIARDDGEKLTEQALAPSGQSDTTVPEKDEMLTEADLPPIEELSAQSDYTVFLKKNVPEALRRRALRKLWVSDPVLANLDGLNDYDDDYTIVQAMTMDDTIYKVGRGLLGGEPEVAELAAEGEPLVRHAPELASESAAATGMDETAEIDTDDPSDNAAPKTDAAAPAHQVGAIEPPDVSESASADVKSDESSAT